jgi:hypothetical protein
MGNLGIDICFVEFGIAKSGTCIIIGMGVGGDQNG